MTKFIVGIILFPFLIISIPIYITFKGFQKCVDMAAFIFKGFRNE